MIIRLGQGFWVDASDGLNWTLLRQKGGKKHPETLGYCSSLGNALQLAVQKGCMEAAGDVSLTTFAVACEVIADDILSEVTIETVADERMGRVLRFKPRYAKKAS